MKHQFHLRPEARPDAALTVRDLSLELNGRTILRDISLNLPARGITCLIGPSGAGKSTLLRCLNRLHDCWRGEIKVQDVSVRRWPGEVETLRRHVGLIGQKPVVFPGSIRANLVFGLPRRLRRRMTAEALQPVLQQAALWPEVCDRLDRPADELSLGQQQRLAIARALILKPKILLLDEPTASLDPHARTVVENALKDLAQRMPLLWVTHDLDQARRLADEVIFLCDGRIIESASVANLFSRPKKIETREFLNWSVCDCPPDRR